MEYITLQLFSSEIYKIFWKMGKIAAGQPMEAVEDNETISVPQELLGRGENFCLKVKGDSMTGDGILDGDIVIINRQSVADNNEMAAVLLK